METRRQGSRGGGIRSRGVCTFCGCFSDASRKLSFSRRLILLARRYGVADRTLWRWVRRYRLGGVDGMRDHVRRDTLTRRAPANVASITPGAPVRLPLDAPTVRATRTSEPRP